MPQYTFPDDFTQRFWEHLRAVSGCWEWQGYRMPNGYGQVRYQGKTYLAHRIAYELTNGAIPAGLHVLHRCDNPPCCNPDHLFLGTHTDNMRDMATKGRGDLQKNPDHIRYGANARRVRFTEQDVRTIRRLYEQGVSQRELARRYQTGKTTIAHIIRHETWPDPE